MGTLGLFMLGVSDPLALARQARLSLARLVQLSGLKPYYITRGVNSTDFYFSKRLLLLWKYEQ